VVGELIEAQVAHHDERVAHLGHRIGDGDIENALRIQRPEPVASLCSGTPKSITPPSPLCAAAAIAARALARVCWTTPGMLAMGTGLAGTLAHEQG
jgi:hypothetical protein